MSFILEKNRKEYKEKVLKKLEGSPSLNKTQKRLDPLFAVEGKNVQVA